jgi:dimethylglycine dehydrogenase
MAVGARRCFIGFAPATVLGISFSGNWRMDHVPNASLFAAYTLRAAGKPHGMKIFGALAVECYTDGKKVLWKTRSDDEFDPLSRDEHL